MSKTTAILVAAFLLFDALDAVTFKLMIDSGRGFEANWFPALMLATGGVGLTWAFKAASSAYVLFAARVQVRVAWRNGLLALGVFAGVVGAASNVVAMRLP